jgi:hypothetical protein
MSKAKLPGVVEVIFNILVKTIYMHLIMCEVTGYIITPPMDVSSVRRTFILPSVCKLQW